jgi:chromate transporter
MNNDRPAKITTHDLLDLAGVFLKLGTTAFGGPAAHVALMEQEFVRKRGWLSHAEFLDLLGIVNLIPGPNSTEMAILIGYRRQGWAGLLLGGICFILPAMLIVSCLAWAYCRFGALPQIVGVLYGVKPVIIAIIAQALWNLRRAAIKTKLLALVGVAAAALSTCGFNVLLVLLLAGVFMAALQTVRHRSKGTLPTLLPFLGFGKPELSLLGTVAVVGTVAAAPFGLMKLFLIFLKTGAVLFGSGYVLLAFLRGDFVEHRHWLTENQLLDAVAVGQFTPGPVFTTATFIGYLLGGPWGALVATVGIFLPAFILVAISGPLIPRLRASPVAGAFLDGVNVASLALMALVTCQLGMAALVDWPAWLLAGITALLLLRYRINSAWLVLSGAAIGLGLSIIVKYLLA